MMRLFKIVGLLISTILLLIIVALFLFRVFSPSYLIPYLIQQVDDETNGRYTLAVSSDSLKIRFINMTVHLGQIEFTRNSDVSAYSGIELFDKFDINARFKSFDIQALNLVRYAFSEKAVVEMIRLSDPEITIRKNRNYKPPNSSKDKQPASATINARDDSVKYDLADSLAWKEFQQAGKSFLPHIVVERFKIENANFDFYGGRVTYPIRKVRGLSFDLKEFQLLKNKDIEISDVSLNIDSVTTLLSKNTARLSIEGFEFHPETFHIDSLHFGHVIDKYRINAIKGFRASWLDIGVKDFNIEGLHPNTFFSDSIIFIDKASIGRVHLNLFKDKEDPKINPDYKALPQEQIRSIPAKIRIDTFEVKRADLIIDMEAPTANTPGQITVDNVELMINNVTNIPEKLAQDPMMNVHISARIMDQIPVTMNYILKTDSEEDLFWATCEVGAFKASVLNDFIGSQFFIQFKSGKIESLEFEIEGNNKANVGTMDFEYSNLKVQKLKGHEKYIDGKPKTGFFVAMGNMLIPTNRSKVKKKYKTAAIYYEKEYNRDIIHGTVMSIVSGLMSSMGFSSKNVEKKKKQAATLDNTSTQKSADKAVKKAEKADKGRKENL